MKHKNHILFLSLVFCIIFFIISGCEKKVAIELNDTEIKEIAYKQFDVPIDQLKILTRSKATFRWSGQEITTAKLIDIRNEKGFDLSIDANKKVVDKVELIKANQDSFVQRYGKIEPALFDSLRRAPEDKLFKVGVWLRTKPRIFKPADRVREKEIIREAQVLRRQLHEALKVENQKLLQSFIATLERKDIKLLYACTTAPLVFLETKASLIRSITENEDIEFVYLARIGKDLNNTAIPTVAGSAWPTTNFEGNGVRIAIVEDDGIDFRNPFLAPANGGSHQADNTNLGHPTQTAGVAASRHIVYRGMAPQATLVSSNGGTYNAADIIAATDWAVGTANADVINCSFGFDVDDVRHDLMARYYDHIVWNEWRSVTPAAGNTGDIMLAPGVAYNVITVGGIDDADTPWHNDDGIYGSTSWQDPPSLHNDREKPEVCAVAMRILTTEDDTYNTNNGQWITTSGGGHNGTSYAAPAVAGAIARLIDRKSFLFTWPEEVKAIVMASAVRRVFDATVDTDNRTVDVEEGVGTVVVPLAEKVVAQNWHHGAYITSSSFPYNYYFDAEKDDIVRFVICWDAHTDASYTTVSLEADLDLHVYDPGGTRVAYSVSYDNPYEIVEFTAPTTGRYRARIRDWRFDGTYEWLGLAWSRR